MNSTLRRILLTFIPFCIGALWFLLWMTVPPLKEEIPLLVTNLIVLATFLLSAFLFIRASRTARI